MLLKHIYRDISNTIFNSRAIEEIKALLSSLAVYPMLWQPTSEFENRERIQ